MKIDYIPDKNMLQIIFDDGEQNITITENGALNFHVVNNSHLPTDEKLITFVSMLFLDKKNEYDFKILQEGDHHEQKV